MNTKEVKEELNFVINHLTGIKNVNLIITKDLELAIYLLSELEDNLEDLNTQVVDPDKKLLIGLLKYADGSGGAIVNTQEQYIVDDYLKYISKE